ncbi:MAG: hypothetical protein PHE84_01885 [bacterium]|nr:hypothetical protein [bacterium]
MAKKLKSPRLARFDRKAAAVLVAGIFLLLPALARSEYVGGEGKSKPGLSVSIEPVFGLTKRDMSGSNGSLTSLRFFLRPTFKIYDRVAFYGDIGAADFHQGGAAGALGLLAGGGAKVFIVSHNQYLNIYADGQFLTFDSDDNGKGGRFFAYQFSLIVSHKESNWNVYAGPKYAQLENGEDADQKVGIVIGMDYSVTPMVFFTAEMHNFTDDGLYVGVGYRF